MTDPGNQMKLKEWLITQIESGRYPGLKWENPEKTIFRIPWKHAAKQDYKEHEDAALFKAWAIYKRKYHEGTDKADPSTWKTRLRCALNKSTDFEEIPQRNQLDLSEPYKVYRVLKEAHTNSEESPMEQLHPREQKHDQPPIGADVHGSYHVPAQVLPVSGLQSIKVEGSAGACCASPTLRAPLMPCEPLDLEKSPMEQLHPREQKHDQPPIGPDVHGSYHVPAPVLPVSVLQRIKVEGSAGVCCASPALRAPLMPSEPLDLGCRVKGTFYGWTPNGKSATPPNPYPVLNETRNVSDFWLHIRLYYRDVLVKEFTTRTKEGCRIMHCITSAEEEQLYGHPYMEQVQFPSPRVLSGCGDPEVTPILERLLPHLDRGMLLWVAPEGVFVKRLCQGRVYWSGPLAPNKDQPNKLEREKTYKLLDTHQFLLELQVFLRNGEPPPRYQIRLCFGEEYPEAPPQNTKKLITAHVEPVFARELFLHAQQMSSQLLHNAQPGDSSAPDYILCILRQLCRS